MVKSEKSKVKRISRRQFFFSLIGITASSGAYAHWIEPFWLDVAQESIAFFPDPQRRAIKLLQISDLHASAAVPFDYIKSSIEQGLQLNPDLICLTGDFITHHLEHEDSYAALLRQLVSSAPVFACLGNHDGGLWAAARKGYRSPLKVINLLERSGIEVLLNRKKYLTIDGRSFWIAGIGDLWSGNCFPEKAFAGIPVDNPHPIIVLAHNPDSKDQLTAFDWQLMLSGHTHGGQVRFPLIGAPFAPVEDKRFIAGLYDWQGRKLHISRGVGNVRGIRFNCRPEINLLHLQ